MLGPVLSEIYPFPASCEVDFIALVFQMRKLGNSGHTESKLCNPRLPYRKPTGLKPATQGIRRKTVREEEIAIKPPIECTECVYFFQAP